MEYMFRKTTTDKIELALNAFASEGWDLWWEFVGGRDWFIIASRQKTQL